MMPHLRRPGIEMSKKELNLLVEHQRQELEKLRKAIKPLAILYEESGACLIAAINSLEGAWYDFPKQTEEEMIQFDEPK